MSINEENAKQKIEDIGTNLPGALEEPDYYIEGSNLIITKGKDGIKVDTENLLQKIKDKLGNINETNDIIEIPVINEKPQDIDIQKYMMKYIKKYKMLIIQKILSQFIQKLKE